MVLNGCGECVKNIHHDVPKFLIEDLVASFNYSLVCSLRICHSIVIIVMIVMIVIIVIIIIIILIVTACRLVSSILWPP